MCALDTSPSPSRPPLFVHRFQVENKLERAFEAIDDLAIHNDAVEAELQEALQDKQDLSDRLAECQVRRACFEARGGGRGRGKGRMWLLLAGKGSDWARHRAKPIPGHHPRTAAAGAAEWRCKDRQCDAGPL